MGTPGKKDEVDYLTDVFHGFGTLPPELWLTKYMVVTVLFTHPPRQSIKLQYTKCKIGLNIYDFEFMMPLPLWP